MKKNLNRIRNYIKKHDTLVLILLTFIFELIIYFLTPHLDDIKYYFIILFILCSGLLLFDKKSRKKNIFYIIYILGVLIRTIYIIQTNIYIRQHDVGVFAGDGHLEYINYIYSRFSLPSTNDWQFYHPPFWHILASGWLWLNKLIGIEMQMALEGIQILTLMFSSTSIIIVNKICERLKLKDRYRYLTVLLIALHPTMIIFSGSINNDCLMTFLEFLIIILLIDWYSDSSIKNTILLAVATGLCVMTKTNGALMAVPIMYVFIKKACDVFPNGKQKIKDYFKRIIIFGIISLPIGLWHQVRSIIKFGKLSTIPSPGDWLYVDNYSLFSRFFSLNFSELYKFINPDYDYNLPIYIIRSSIFGEFSFNTPGILNILFVSVNMILIISSLIFMVRYIIRDRKSIIINMLVITFITSMISMYIFNYKYPYACSMDFRYIVITLVPGIIIITYSLNIIKNKIIKISIEIISYIFAVLSLVFYFII